MKIIKNNFIPVEGFAAINICGVVFTRKNSLNDRTINHEEIHTAQIKELWYVGFYILYLLEYVVNIFKFGYKSAYRKISFEQEAYDFDKYPNYLKNRKKFKWIEYVKNNFKKQK